MELLLPMSVNSTSPDYYPIMMTDQLYTIICVHCIVLVRAQCHPQHGIWDHVLQGSSIGRVVGLLDTPSF
eukprot:scaffold46425_cov55-Attheya_sp.AAC.1